MFWPCETRTSTCRSFATISSGLYRFLAITVLLDVKRHTSSRTTSVGADHGAGAKLVGALLAWSAWSFQASLDYKTSGVAKADDLILVVLLPFLIFFQAGTFVAAWQMTNLDTYTVGTTKGASIENARLLRASSAGFIVFAEERVLFIPQSQIARIMATPKFSPKPADRLCPWGYINL